MEIDYERLGQPCRARQVLGGAVVRDRKDGRERLARNREPGGGLAGQQGDRVFELRALHPEIDRLRLRGLELGLREHHVGPGDRARVVLVLR